MMPIEIFFAVFLTLVVIGLAVFFVIIKLKLQTEESENDIIWNFASNKCNKRGTGVLKDIIVGRKGRTLISYTPKGVNSNVENENESKIIVDKYIDVPRGSLEKDRGLKILFPKNPEDMPECINSTEFGKGLSKGIETKNVENNIIATLRESRNRQDTLQLLQGGGELSKSEIKKLGELFDEISALMVKSAEKKHME